MLRAEDGIWRCVTCISRKSLIFLTLLFAAIGTNGMAANARFDRVSVKEHIVPPYEIGEKDPNLPLYALTNAVGTQISYVFQSIDLIQIPGFSGEPPNLLIQMDNRIKVAMASVCPTAQEFAHAFERLPTMAA